MTNAAILFRLEANTKGHLHSHARFYLTSYRSPNAVKAPPVPPDFPYPISSVNDFLIGNLLPDATQQKESSHFRDPLYREKMMVFPDLTRFTAKYRSLLPDSSALGYYFHLYIDRKFLRIFIPQIVEFYNADGEYQI